MNRAYRQMRAARVNTYRGRGLGALDGPRPPRTLVKSPGIALDSPLLARARERGVEIIDELELGWRLSRAPLVGVTGTNGKSTVAALSASVLRAAGRDALVAGNTEYGPPLSALPRDPDWVVCEVSSFQLEGCPALLPEVAVFTNVSRDHLARHGTMREYAELKRRLFVRGDAAVPLAVINVDDPFGARLAVEVERRGGRAIRYGATRGSDYRLESARWDLRSAEVTISTPAGRCRLKTRLPGRHNALNVAAAIALSDALGVERAAAERVIGARPGLPGRFQLVAEPPGHSHVVVDMALSPAAVEQFLLAARAALPRGGRLHALVGLLGRAEPEHCHAIGAAARALADELVLTLGTFRPYPHPAGLESLAAGAARSRGARVRVVPTRRDAIATVLAGAGPEDVVALLGRGDTRDVVRESHGRARSLDDATVVRESLSLPLSRAA